MLSEDSQPSLAEQLAAAARAGAEADADAPEEPRERFAILRVGATGLAIAGAECTGVVELQTATRLPRAPRHVLGVLALRGRIVPLVDIGSLLGSGPRERIPVGLAVTSERMNAVLAADEVLGFELVRRSAVEPSAQGDGSPPCGCGWLRADGRDVMVLDIPAVLRAVLPPAERRSGRGSAR